MKFQRNSAVKEEAMNYSAPNLDKELCLFYVFRIISLEIHV